MHLKQIPKVLQIAMKENFTEYAVTIDAAGICHLHDGKTDVEMSIESFEAWCEMTLVGAENNDN